jgi:hypothetical protein
MKRRLIGVFIVIAVLIGVVVWYHFNTSISSVLKRQGFTANDIITVEGYSSDAEHITKIILLANRDKLGIVGLTKQGFGKWIIQPMTSVIDNPTNGEYSTSAMSIMKNQGENFYNEKHVFVATYLDNKSEPFIVGNSDFYLNVDYFTVNGKLLLFAHAIAGKSLERFGADDVIFYLNKQFQ